MSSVFYDKMLEIGTCVVDALKTSTQSKGFDSTWAKHDSAFKTILDDLRACENKSGEEKQT